VSSVSIILNILLAACVVIPCSASADSSANVLAGRRALAAGKPYTSVVPRSNEPTGQLTVLRICPDSVNMMIALGSLEGIVNRDKPKLYLGLDKTLSWLERHGGKITIKVEPDPFKIFDKFKDQVKGIVIYDDSLDALTNIAITYAGIEDLIPADPELAKTLADRFGWKVVHDLRGRWTTRVEAYTWAFEHLLPKCTKYALMHYNHGYRPSDTGDIQMEPQDQKLGYGVDYAVAFRMFVWHMTRNAGPDEMKLGARIMESLPLYTPVFGRSTINNSYDEPALVGWIAKYANLHIPFSAGNVSVLSGARVPDEDLKQKQSPIRDLGPDKVYVAFTNSEHDNMEHVIGGGPPWHLTGMETDDPYRIWWSDAWRGRVAIGWPIGPLLCELAPTTLAQFVATATENDYFMAALSGLCLSSLGDFGSAYPAAQDELAAGYAKLTGDYMKRLGWTMVNPAGPPGDLRTLTRNIPGLEGLFEGYGMHQGMTYEKADYLLDGVPVFHSLTGGIAGEGRAEPIAVSYARRAKTLVDQINAVKVDERPAFIHSWTIGWDYGPTILKMVADQLPKDYVVVRPDELAALFKKYKGAKAELKSVNPTVPASGAITETPDGDNGLAVDTGKIKVEIAWGKAPEQAPIRRIMGVDGKWRGAGGLITYNPDELTAKSLDAERTLDTAEEKDYRLSYVYNDGSTQTFLIRACAGQPYVLVDEQCSRGDVPSWRFDTFPGFKPNTLFTDVGERSVVTQGLDALGGLPWYRWMLVGNKDGPERDQIGVFLMSAIDWTNGDSVFWCRPYEGYFEFYHQRAGTKKFAIAALDKNDPDAPKRIWNELNGK